MSQLKKSNKYWKQRFDQINQTMMDNSEDWMMRNVKDIYVKAYADIEKQISRVKDIRDFARLNSLKYYIEERINKLGTDEYNIIKRGLTNHVGSFSLATPNAADQIIEKIWCSDGKSWSDRIWLDKIKLKSALKDVLTKVIIEGASGADLVKAMQDQSKFYSTMVNPDFQEIVDKQFNQSFNNASRLVRTELTYVHNQCSVERYKEMGCEEYEYVAENNEKTCEMCQELNGKVFRLDEAEVGVNLPCLHCGCRCTIVPVVKI